MFHRASSLVSLTCVLQAPTAAPQALRGTSTTVPGRLAGAIKKRWEENGNVQLQPIGMQAVASSVKATAIANDYIKDEKKDARLAAWFTYVPLEDKAILEFKIEPLLESEWPSKQAFEDGGEMRTPKNMSGVSKLASAISKRYTDEGHATVTAMGPSSIFLSVKAIAAADGFLRKEGGPFNGTEKHLVAVPKFETKTYEDGNKFTRMLLHCVGHDFAR